jgi:hypothetical protein
VATLTVIRKAIGAGLERLPGVVVNANIAEGMTLGDWGGVVVGGPTADLTNTMGRGNVTWSIPIYALAPLADYDRATAILDALVNPYGDLSIPELFWNYGRAAGELDQGFGVVDSNELCDLDAHISELTAYGVEFPNAGIPHLGAVLTCVAHSPGRPT